jgi:hypothetical protein
LRAHELEPVLLQLVRAPAAGAQLLALAGELVRARQQELDARTRGRAAEPRTPESE